MSNKTLEFIVPGKPGAKGRPRFSTQGGKIRTYTPEETANYEQLVKIYCQQAIAQLDEPWELDGQFELSVSAYIPRPKSRPKVWQKLAVRGFIRPIVKPDWDNVGKIVSDALNGIAYRDDSAVVSARTDKWYTDERDVPLVSVCIRDITHPEDRWSRPSNKERT